MEPLCDECSENQQPGTHRSEEGPNNQGVPPSVHVHAHLAAVPGPRVGRGRPLISARSGNGEYFLFRLVRLSGDKIFVSVQRPFGQKQHDVGQVGLGVHAVETLVVPQPLVDFIALPSARIENHVSGPHFDVFPDGPGQEIKDRALVKFLHVFRGLGRVDLAAVMRFHLALLRFERQLSCHADLHEKVKRLVCDSPSTRFMQGGAYVKNPRMGVKSRFAGLPNHSVRRIIWQCRAEMRHKLCSFGWLGTCAAKVASRGEQCAMS